MVKNTKIEMDGEVLSEECVDDLLNLEHCPKMMIVCTSLLGGMTDKIMDPATGKALEGVEIKLPGKEESKEISWIFGTLWYYVYSQIMQISTVSPAEMIQLYSSFIYNTTDALKL